MGRLAGAVIRVRGIVWKGRVFDQMPDDVDAEAVDSLIQPKPEYVMHGVDDFAIAPVQIRLRGEERMIVILACLAVELPGASPEFRQPIVGRTAVGRGVAPDVPISFRIRSGGSAPDEPGMLVGRMIRHEVEQYLQALRMCGFEKS